MNQGLHHLRPEQLPRFLDAVTRVLRPGGLFIVREHDMSDERLRPMLDCAHMVFNAVFGVAPAAERTEIRGFRPLLEWRAIVESGGQLSDTRVYEMQPHDCTVDVMMCFVKKGVAVPRTDVALVSVSDTASRVAAALPKIALDAGLGLVNSLLKTLPDLRKFLVAALAALLPNVPGVTSAISVRIQATIDEWLTMLERFQPLADVAVPVSSVEGVSSGPSLVPEELYLLIPVMRLRAKKGGIMEAIIVDFYDRVVEALAADEKDPKRSASSGGGVAPSGKQLDAAEFDAQLAALLESVPILGTPEQAIADAGLGSKATQLLLAAFSPDNALKLRAWALANVDATTWALIRASLGPVKSEGQPPTLGRITTAGSAWNHFALALLGCPALQLSWAQGVGLTSVGLSPLVELYHSAQAKRRRDDARSPSTLPPEALAKLKVPLDQFTEVVTRTVPLGAAGNPPDIAGVLCVESAHLLAHSLTRLLSDTQTDVLVEVAQCLDPATGTLALSSVKLPATWRAGKHSLVLTLRLLPEAIKNTAQCAPLIRALDELSIIDVNWRKGNLPFTYLKLPEWMLAELVSLMGQTMDHTPFYRFPFMAALRVYLKVLIQETRLVAERTGAGYLKTILSDAFITDFVGAVITSLGFGALNAVSIPIKMVTGESYPKETLVETLLLTAPRGVPWEALCGGPECIRHATEVTAGVHHLTIPTFKPFTRVLVAIAQHVPAATLLSVSNLHVLQVRLSLASPGSGASFLAMAGVEQAVTFAYPQVGPQVNPTQLCLSVQVPQLLALLRAVLRAPHLATVHQVYDTFNYD